MSWPTLHRRRDKKGYDAVNGRFLITLIGNYERQNNWRVDDRRDPPVFFLVRTLADVRNIIRARCKSATTADAVDLQGGITTDGPRAKETA